MSAPYDEEMLAYLKAIDQSLRALVKLHQAAAPKPVLDDHALDSKYGDPTVRFMPRFWTGDTFKGQPYSACPADLLDLVAESMEWSAAQAELKDEHTDSGKPIAPMKRLDAARARAWAARKRKGWVAKDADFVAPAWAEPPEDKAPPLPPWHARPDDISF